MTCSLQVNEATPSQHRLLIPLRTLDNEERGSCGSPHPGPQLGVHSTTQNGSPGTGTDLLKDKAPSWASTQHTLFTPTPKDGHLGDPCTQEALPGQYPVYTARVKHQVGLCTWADAHSRTSFNEITHSVGIQIMWGLGSVLCTQ